MDEIIGHKAEMSKGVYKYTIGKQDVNLGELGARVTPFLGFNTWAACQGTPEKAAVANFAMLEDEVAPVIKALIGNNIEVVAVHNHMVHEELNPNPIKLKNKNTTLNYPTLAIKSRLSFDDIQYIL